MKPHGSFQPDWTSSPGDTIIDLLRERALSQSSFASLMSLTSQDATDLLNGRSTITLALARQLSTTFGASVEFWMSRDFQYRQDAKRLHGAGEEWLRRLPLADMIRFQWLTPPPAPSEELDASLRFFNVSDVSDWEQRYGILQEMTAFRTSPSFDSRHESLAAWLRQGEIQAEQLHCQTWCPEQFQRSLTHIRSLTRQKNPRVFMPQVQSICSKSGVAVVVVRSPSGCRASGATRFITKTKAVLQLSFRYLTDDHFWFTFFHEAGHLLLHGERHYYLAALRGQRHWILEGLESPRPEEEQEANQFAADVLIPPEFQSDLLTLPTQTRHIIRLASKIGVSPGILVGQLQHAGRLGFDQLNSLKRRFQWT